MKKLLLCLLLAALVVACSPGGDPEGGDESSTTSQADPTTTTGADDGPERVTTTDPDREGVSVTDRVVESAIEQAVSDSGLDADSLQVRTAQQVVWNDASLGCPQEGQSYIQVLTDGYWVILESPDGELDYRSTLEMDFRRCENGQPPQSILEDR